MENSYLCFFLLSIRGLTDRFCSLAFNLFHQNRCPVQHLTINSSSYSAVSNFPITARCAYRALPRLRKLKADRNQIDFIEVAKECGVVSKGAA